MKYYKLTENMELTGRWYLGSIDNLSYEKQYAFRASSLFSINEELSISIDIDGYALDYTKSLGYGIPIISNKAKQILSDYNVVFSTLKVFYQKNYVGEYYALGTELIECINENEAIYTKFTENDPVRPDRAGDYSAIYKIVLDKNKIQYKHIFHIKRYETCLIVSEEIKNKIEDTQLIGFDFTEVEVI